MDSVSAWLMVVILGTFHGINPAMGWLFVVALGLHRQSQRVVLLSVLAIGAGHALSIAIVVILTVLLGVMIDKELLQTLAGVLLIGWAGYHTFYGHRHRIRVGLQTGMAGLTSWSFLMATGHGAGLMLMPLLMPVDGSDGHGHHHAAASLIAALTAVAVHIAVMMTVIGIVSTIVYRWIGLGFPRRKWINLDLVWIVTLIGTGVFLIASGLGALPSH